MPPSQLERVKATFAEAMERPESERPAFLKNACGGDAELRAEVEAFLSAAQQAGDFMTSPTFENAGPTVDMPATKLREGAGSIIGRYKLLQQIGEGGFGVVFMAEQTEPVRRKVALKIIKLGMDTRQVVARFEAERQALAMMDHPHIARVLDAGATETGRPYFVMELVKGVPITDYCNENKLTTRQRLELFIPVCGAVQSAHQKGIIHRDLKPSNVLVTLHDDKPIPKIIDFGIAKATQTSLTDKTLFTEFRQMIGTPTYMSPEQAQMSGLDIDTRADIYSLGVLLYELLAGTTPFDPKQLMAAAYAEIQRIILEVEPPRPSTRLSGLPQETQATVARQRQSEPKRLSHLLRGDLDCIILKCLEKDRTRRYDTASALAMDVQCHLKNEPVIARPASLFYRSRKWVRRNKLGLASTSAVTVILFVAVLLSVGTALAASLAVVITLFLGVVVSLGQALRASRARSEEARQRLEAERAREEAVKAQVNEMKLREQAQRRFGEVQKLARVLMFDLHSKVARLAGSTPAVQLMFHTAQEYLEALGADAGDDEMLQRDIAQVYEKVGEIQGSPNRLTEVGDSRGALVNYKRALAIRQKLATSSPSNSADQRALAMCMAQMGALQIHMNDMDGAKENFRAAQEILEKLARESASDLQVRLDLAEVLRFAGDARSMGGDLNGAMESYYRSAGMLTRLLVLAPELSSTYVTTLLQLASVEICRADVFVESGRSADGLDHYRKCLSTYRSAIVSDPSDARARRGEAMTQLRIGEVLMTLGDPEAAAESFRQALETLRHQAEVDPVNAKAQLLLAWCCGDLAGALEKVGEFTPALQNLFEAHVIYERLALQDPGNMNKLMSTGGTHYRIGDTLAATGDFKGALDRYLKCNQVAEKLITAFPSDPLYHRHLAATHTSIGRMLGRLGRGDEALEHLAKALSLTQKALNSDSSNIYFQNTLAMVHEDTGDVLAARDDATSAAENYQRSLDIRINLSDADPDNAEVRGETLGVLRKLGKLSMQMARAEKNAAESLPLWLKARELLESALRQHNTLLNDDKVMPAESKTGAEIQADLDACATAIAALETGNAPP